MSKRLFGVFVLSLAIATALAGCGGGGKKQQNTSGPVDLSNRSLYITTIAGTGIDPDSSNTDIDGDNCPALNANIQPSNITLDREGNIYFVDGSAIRKIDKSGIITRIAGQSTAGPYQNNIKAIDAYLSKPKEIVFDNNGNLYVTDSDNSCVRKIDKSGIITTYVGPQDDATIKFELIQPWGLAIDSSGNLYISDANGSINSVFKVSASGNVTTIASNTTGADFRSPCSLTIDPAGNLYVVDAFHHCIKKITPSGNISIVAGNGTLDNNSDGGLATEAKLGILSQIATDPYGNLYICDTSNHCIRKISPSGIITTVIGTNGEAGYAGDNGLADQALLLFPYGIAVDSNTNFYICDTGNFRIRVAK